MKAGRAMHFAGWLIADVMVLLFVVGLSAFAQAPSSEEPDEKVPATTTTGSATTSSITVTTTTGPPPVTPPPSGLERDPFCVSISPSGDPAAELGAVLSQSGVAGRAAGMVISFGIAADPGPGRARAQAVNTSLRTIPTFAGAPMRAFWDTEGVAGGVNVEVYFLTQAGRALPRTSCPWIER